MTNGDDKQPDSTVAVAITAAALLGAAFALGALALYGTRSALSVSVGATVAVANMLAMTAIIRALLPGDDPEPPPPDPPGDDEQQSDQAGADDARHKARSTRFGLFWGAFAAVKMVLVFGGIWILLTRGLVDPIPLLVGYGAMPLGIVVSAIWPSLTRRG